MGVLGAVLGSLAGSAASALLSQSSADKQMAFQKKMSNTAYRRAVKDMRAAGLNPILAAKLGGASTPSGAMANIPDFGAGITNGINSAMSMDQTQANVLKIEADIEKIAADIGLTEHQIDRLKQLLPLEIEKITSETDKNTAFAAIPGAVRDLLAKLPGGGVGAAYDWAAERIPGAVDYSAKAVQQAQEYGPRKFRQLGRWLQEKLKQTVVEKFLGEGPYTGGGF